MGGDTGGSAGIGGERAPLWDRFAHWPRLRARLALLALALLLIASALVPIGAGPATVGTKSLAQVLADEEGPKRARDDDLALYDQAIERIRQGESYYDFIVEEQRRANYPVRPGLAVRLPTLAYIDALLGTPGQIAAAAILLLAVLVAWWRRFGAEPGGTEHRLVAIALLGVGASLGLTRHFFVLHELWAGMLLALSFGLHRAGAISPLPLSFARLRPRGGAGGGGSPDRAVSNGESPHPNPSPEGEGRSWVASLAVAALALAIREHALPFILLMAALAFGRRDWKEGAAWSALALVFLAALAVHLQIVAAQVLPNDPESPSWLALRGLSGWLSNVVLSSNLRFLPHWLAGPLVILMVLGWTGWRSPAGSFGALLYLGYGLGFMLAGRPENYYWGAVVAPAMPIGLAFAPRALKSLTRSALSK